LFGKSERIQHPAESLSGIEAARGGRRGVIERSDFRTGRRRSPRSGIDPPARPGPGHRPRPAGSVITEELASTPILDVERLASVLGLISKSASVAMAAFHRLHGAVADAHPAPAGERWDYDGLDWPARPVVPEARTAAERDTSSRRPRLGP
jgi:hypothetical protein